MLWRRACACLGGMRRYIHVSVYTHTAAPTPSRSRRRRLRRSLDHFYAPGLPACPPVCAAAAAVIDNRSRPSVVTYFVCSLFFSAFPFLLSFVTASYMPAFSFRLSLSLVLFLPLTTFVFLKIRSSRVWLHSIPVASHSHSSDTQYINAFEVRSVGINGWFRK